MISQPQVLELKDAEMILMYEELKRKESLLSEEDAIFASWDSRGRKESLEYYLPLGWSFAYGHFYGSDKELNGYFLAQPLIFFEGHTQSLWIEHIQYNSLKVRDELCETAYRMARDKHFQRIYFPKAVHNAVSKYRLKNWGPDHILITL